MSKLCRVLAIIFVLNGAFSVQGQIAIAEKPKVAHSDGQLTFENFPAYSKKNNSLAIIHQRYSCCYGSAQFLLRVDIGNMEVQEKIMLSAAEDSIDLVVLDENSVVRKIQQMIAAGDYEAMTEIQNKFFSIESGQNGDLYKISYRLAEEIKETSIRLADVMLPGHCCNGGIADSTTCKFPPNRFRLWLDASHKLLLIEYGIVLDQNGCDYGPAYHIKKIG